MRQYQPLSQSGPSNIPTQESPTDDSTIEKFVQWSNELFEALMQSPLHFTLDQILSMVSTFKQQLLQKFQAKVSDKEKGQELPVLETFQMIPEDVDFRVPTVKVTYNGKLFKGNLLDGGSRVNILLESMYLGLEKAKLELEPFQLKMDDQRRLQPVGIIQDQAITMVGLTFRVNFVVLKMQKSREVLYYVVGKTLVQSSQS